MSFGLVFVGALQARLDTREIKAARLLLHTSKF